jgi:hypothetical protein
MKTATKMTMTMPATAPGAKRRAAVSLGDTEEGAVGVVGAAVDGAAVEGAVVEGAVVEGAGAAV